MPGDSGLSGKTNAIRIISFVMIERESLRWLSFGNATDGGYKSSGGKAEDESHNK